MLFINNVVLSSDFMYRIKLTPNPKKNPIIVPLKEIKRVVAVPNKNCCQLP